MADTSKYDTYLALKKKVNYKHNGVDYAKVLAHDLSALVFVPEKTPTLRETVRHFLYRPDTTPLLNAFKSSNNVFTSVINRGDYKNQISKTMEQLSSAQHVSIEDLPKKIRLAPFRILKTIAFCNKLLGRQASLRWKLYIAGKFCYYLSLQKNLETVFGNATFNNNYIAFNSAYQAENVVCQYLNKLNVSTHSLSHGVFTEFRQFIPLDVINAENSVAGKVLVWGQSSAQTLQRLFNLSPAQTQVAGNLKYPAKQIAVKQSFKNCIIFLARRIYHQGNLQILDIVKNYLQLYPDISFSVKLHPSEEIAWYKDYQNIQGITFVNQSITLDNLLQSQAFDFSIVNNSNAYYEAMYFDMVCLRYGPDENDIFYGIEDRFSDVETLHALIQSFRVSDTAELNKNITSILTNSIGMGVNNYKKILQNKVD